MAIFPGTCAFAKGGASTAGVFDNPTCPDELRMATDAYMKILRTPEREKHSLCLTGKPNARPKSEKLALKRSDNQTTKG